MKIHLAKKGEAGRDILPVLNTASLIELDDEFGGVSPTIDALRADKGWRKATVKVATILCNEALVQMGEEPNLKYEEMLRMIEPTHLPAAGMACLQAIIKGMHMEHKIQTAPRDPVLEEIEKKEEPAKAACGS